MVLTVWPTVAVTRQLRGVSDKIFRDPENDTTIDSCIVLVPRASLASRTIVQCYPVMTEVRNKSKSHRMSTLNIMGRNNTWLQQEVDRIYG